MLEKTLGLNLEGGGGGNHKKLSDDKTRFYLSFLILRQCRYLHTNDYVHSSRIPALFSIDTRWVDVTHPFDSGDACGFLLSKYFNSNRDVKCDWTVQSKISDFILRRDLKKSCFRQLRILRVFRRNPGDVKRCLKLIASWVKTNFSAKFSLCDKDHLKVSRAFFLTSF